MVFVGMENEIATSALRMRLKFVREMYQEPVLEVKKVEERAGRS
jgi:hypothetical protein